MRFPHFFIERPIFATVSSTLFVVAGAISYFQLPVAQYPQVALPTVQVRGVYPGATAKTVAETVATPLEQEINGVEGMLYMESQSTGDGRLTLTVTFSQGTDVDQAQVLVQNRVSVAEPRLPEAVRRIGLVTRKQSPDLMLLVHLTSPDRSLDSLYISNYAYLQMRDALSRIEGVGDVQVFGAREYSMRVWLDMDQLASLDLTAGDVIGALRRQNTQVAAGQLGSPPIRPAGANQISVTTRGRLADPEAFGKVVVKDSGEGQVVQLNDVARVELGARDYSINSYLDDDRAVALAVFQRPGSNAVATASRIKDTVDELADAFPPGLKQQIIYNPTDFVEQSIDEVFVTLFMASGLVILTVFVFLQSWRATVIPVVAIPIALVGTFAALFAFGFSLNQLSLFGLVLAIGIVVDDAIVVVENCQRLMQEQDLSPRRAAHQAMDEVGSALIATTLVLCAVFVPTAFLPGISGQFYRQFAVTIAISTVVSTFVSLTLSPALAALVLRPPSQAQDFVDRTLRFVLGWFFKPFNRFFDWFSGAYASATRRVVRARFLSLLVYAALSGVTVWVFQRVPNGFIPSQDQGYVIVSVELPPGRSLFENDAVTGGVGDRALQVDGVAHVVKIVGLSGASRTRASNSSAVFVVLEDAKQRADAGQSMQKIIGQLRTKLAAVDRARVVVIPPPPVPGIGTGGGVKMQLQDRGENGFRALERKANGVVAAAREAPSITQPYSTFQTATPQLDVDVDRVKARQLQVPISRVFEALQVYLGSTYVNDFNYLGRVYRVTAQAEGELRDEPSDILRLRTRSHRGAMVPLGSLVQLTPTTGPDRIVHFNLFPAADINATVAEGASTGKVIEKLEEIAGQLPDGFGYAWTDLAYQETQAGNTVYYIFPLGVLFVFLTLAAQYESWLLPLAIILIVPMCVLFAMLGVWVRGMDNNILTQIGLIVLVGLASKNAILIVEFAKQNRNEGKSRIEAAVEACRLRLRPILMTALSFLLGVVPLVIATGAGSEMRRALGTAVFAGMLGVTLVGLFLTSVFYVVLSRASSGRDDESGRDDGPEDQPSATSGQS